MQQKRRSEQIGKRSYHLLTGPKSGLGMSERLEVHRIPAGVQDQREHNKHLLLPVMSHVSEEFRKKKEANEMGKNWHSPETWKLHATYK